MEEDSLPEKESEEELPAEETVLDDEGKPSESDEDIVDTEVLPADEFIEEVASEPPQLGEIAEQEADEAESDTKTQTGPPPMRKTSRKLPTTRGQPKGRGAQERPPSKSKKKPLRDVVQVPVEPGGQKKDFESDEPSRRIVIEWEKERGRESTGDLPDNQEGYDVETRDAKGNIRRIEIKGSKGNLQNAMLSLPQVRDALAETREDGEIEYWLYIVEYNKSQNHNVIAIPWTRFDAKFAFKKGSWKEHHVDG